MEPDTTLGRDDVLMLLGGMPERLGDLVSGFEEERLHHRHGPAFPTAAEVLLHMAAGGRAFDRVLQQALIEGETADLGSALEPHAAPDDGALAPAVDEFRRARRGSLELLRGIAPEVWERTLREGRDLEVTLLDACRKVLAHELGHLSQLRNLTALLPEPADLGTPPR